VLSDTTSPSDQDHGSGLWLWHGKAPLTPSPPQPAPRARQILGPNVSGLRRRGWMALPGGVVACIARGHSALDASGQAIAGGYARGGRTSPFARRGARGHPRATGGAYGHPVGSGANAVRAGCTIASPGDRARTGDKGGAPHISANGEKNPHIRWQKFTIRHPRSAHAAGSDG
jgi:hypothetical protein